MDLSLPDGLHKCNDWEDGPAGPLDTQGNCLVITYLYYADLGQYWGRRIYFPANDGNAIYVNNCSIGVWQGWERITTDAPPQKFDLPLAEGLEPIEPCRYSKDQFGRVLVNIDCKPTTGSVSIGENQSLSIGTLPEGFRPAHYTSNACEVIVGQSRYIGTFDINEYGALTLWTAAPSASIIIGSVLFDTA